VDDGIQRSGSHGSDHSRGAALGFSTSVPIDVPAWMRSSMNQSTFNYHDSDDVSQHNCCCVEASGVFQNCVLTWCDMIVICSVSKIV